MAANLPEVLFFRVVKTGTYWVNGTVDWVNGTHGALRYYSVGKLGLRCGFPDEKLPRGMNSGFSDDD